MGNWYLDLEHVDAGTRRKMEELYDAWWSILQTVEHLKKDDVPDQDAIAKLEKRADAVHQEFSDLIGWYIHKH